MYIYIILWRLASAGAGAGGAGAGAGAAGAARYLSTTSSTIRRPDGSPYKSVTAELEHKSVTAE